ncbi:zinc finger protein on ecdysone puffs isoform X2 [Cylas formicarius]|uniref:zinc finger protein on ecdysone puffs isoform X2 n=1 Tax=Cylas formicarius TaxID=197179 RepID=UPI0029586763|nr:zinc finger protein on ecdysone puffs isoform X2 [Cylas formicarius]
MSNRRMGGMGGPRGNRSFSQQPFQGGVSPWQGNSNNMNQGGLLSQLTSNPQLALALTSLLQPQQQQMNNPPSLLSLNTSAFSQNRDFGRFGNRGRDIRRHEPYNKNRGGWRNDYKGRPNNKNQKDNKPKDIKKKDEKKDDKKDVKVKKDDSADTTIDLSIDEEKDNEKKRDWKDEKNQADLKEESGDEEEKDNKEGKEGRYVGVPQKYLSCFVCNKQMWDGESMGKHVRGRAHRQMMKSLEESIHITVNILRENMRLTEERKMIELNRMQRLKKFGKNFHEPESHCNMCDLKFMGKIVSHRRTDGHQRLKRYLHPNCRLCDKEFPSRMEWVEHRLTPEHLLNIHELTEGKIGGANGMEVMENENDDVDLEPILEEPLQMEVENPILELDDNLDGMQNLLPAYKKDRPVSTKSLKPFSGFMCELCNRSFADEKDAQDHLKTNRHYFKFIEAVKEKYHRKEKKERREREEKAKKEKELEEESQNGEVDEGEEGGGDQDMYDPEEVTNEEDASMNEASQEEESVLENLESSQEEQEPEDVKGKVEPTQELSEQEQETVDVNVEPEPEPEKVEVKIEPKKSPVRKAAAASKPAPASVKKAIAKNGAGPRSKKARKQ